jgi:acetyl-CoA C-acetyltransferase
MPEAYIYDHVRTPRGRGRVNGALHEVPPIELVVQVLAALRRRCDLDTGLIDDVVLGVVQPVGEQGCNIARAAVLHAGYDQGVPGQQINRFCSSGLDAVNTAAAQIMSGQADLVIAGGVESMSRVPMGADGGGAWSSDPIVTYDAYFAPQGIGADLIATRWGYSREDLDRYAYESQQRAAKAWSQGNFARSVIPVEDELGFTLLDHDEHIRPTRLEDLAALKAAFSVMGEKGGYDAIALQRYPDVFAIEHVHTAGNSSGIVDGAAGVLIGSRTMGARLDLQPRARIRSFASVGSDPTIMLLGPQPASEKALKNAGMSRGDIDLFELNEAFASVVLRYMEALDIQRESINVNGGAIAMGHPLGATGAMILGTVLDELERTGKGTALAALCVGMGMGTATIIERL